MSEIGASEMSAGFPARASLAATVPHPDAPILADINAHHLKPEVHAAQLSCHLSVTPFVINAKKPHFHKKWGIGESPPLNPRLLAHSAHVVPMRVLGLFTTRKIMRETK
jgi:hypothetical protein